MACLNKGRWAVYRCLYEIWGVDIPLIAATADLNPDYMQKVADREGWRQIAVSLKRAPKLLLEKLIVTYDSQLTAFQTAHRYTPFDEKAVKSLPPLAATMKTIVELTEIAAASSSELESAAGGAREDADFHDARIKLDRLLEGFERSGKPGARAERGAGEED